MRSLRSTSSQSLPATSASSTRNKKSLLNRAYDNIRRVQFSVNMACVAAFGCWLSMRIEILAYHRLMRNLREEGRRAVNRW